VLPLVPAGDCPPGKTRDAPVSSKDTAPERREETTMFRTFCLTLLISVSAAGCALSGPEYNEAVGSFSTFSADDTDGSDTELDVDDTGMEPESCAAQYDQSITEQGLDWDNDLGAYIMPLNHEFDVEVEGCLESEVNNTGIIFIAGGQPLASAENYQHLDGLTTGSGDMWIIVSPENEGFTFYYSPNP